MKELKPNHEYYMDTEPRCVVNVLGVPCAIYDHVPIDDDPMLETCSGYYDKTADRIVVCAQPEDSELADWESYRKQCLRHEIIHAFMHHSGIDGNCRFDVVGEEHPEHIVAWISIQFPKLLKAFTEAGAL